MTSDSNAGARPRSNRAAIVSAAVAVILLFLTLIGWQTDRASYTRAISACVDSMHAVFAPVEPDANSTEPTAYPRRDWKVTDKGTILVAEDGTEALAIPRKVDPECEPAYRATHREGACLFDGGQLHPRTRYFKTGITGGGFTGDRTP